jgi:hypothetical protein
MRTTCHTFCPLPFLPLFVLFITALFQFCFTPHSHLVTPFHFTFPLFAVSLILPPNPHLPAPQFNLHLPIVLIVVNCPLDTSPLHPFTTITITLIQTKLEFCVQPTANWLNALPYSATVICAHRYGIRRREEDLRRFYFHLFLVSSIYFLQ